MQSAQQKISRQMSKETGETNTLFQKRQQRKAEELMEQIESCKTAQTQLSSELDKATQKYADILQQMKLEYELDDTVLEEIQRLSCSSQIDPSMHKNLDSEIQQIEAQNEQFDIDIDNANTQLNDKYTFLKLAQADLVLKQAELANFRQNQQKVKQLKQEYMQTQEELTVVHEKLVASKYQLNFEYIDEMEENIYDEFYGKNVEQMADIKVFLNLILSSSSEDSANQGSSTVINKEEAIELARNQQIQKTKETLAEIEKHKNEEIANMQKHFANLKRQHVEAMNNTLNQTQNSSLSNDNLLKELTEKCKILKEEKQQINKKKGTLNQMIKANDDFQALWKNMFSDMQMRIQQFKELRKRIVNQEKLLSKHNMVERNSKDINQSQQLNQNQHH